MTYVDGFVLAVPAANREAYRSHALKALPIFKDFGAARMVEGWADDVPDGKDTDLKGAVNLEPEEVVVFSWIEYPSRAVRDDANQRMMSDPRMQEMGPSMPFDGRRMIFGGFEVIGQAGPGGAMGYVDGAVIPVPTDARGAYQAQVARQAAVFIEYGATRVIDAWGDDVPVGQVTDFRRAVKARDDETVAFSWVEWPSKAVRDAGLPRVMGDPRMAGDRDAAIDMGRMVFGGFTPIVDG